jgi:hypothetical protein
MHPLKDHLGECLWPMGCWWHHLFGCNAWNIGFKSVKKTNKKNNLCNSPFYFGASFVWTKNWIDWQCWFAKQPSQGGGQWHTYCHGPQFCNLLW